MAGSYRHIANAKNEFIGTDLIDNLGDAYEALEECYDMIQWLSGGDLSKIHQAWRDGHCKPQRVTDEPQLFTYAQFWDEEA